MRFYNFVEDPWSNFGDWLSTGEQAIMLLEEEERKRSREFDFQVRVDWQRCSATTGDILDWLLDNVGRDNYYIQVPPDTCMDCFKPERVEDISDFFFREGTHAMLFKLTWLGI